MMRTSLIHHLIVSPASEEDHLSLTNGLELSKFKTSRMFNLELIQSTLNCYSKRVFRSYHVHLDNRMIGVYCSILHNTGNNIQTWPSLLKLWRNSSCCNMASNWPSSDYNSEHKLNQCVPTMSILMMMTSLTGQMLSPLRWKEVIFARRWSIQNRWMMMMSQMYRLYKNACQNGCLRSQTR